MAREKKLEMTPAEALDFLCRKSVLILATVDADGVAVGDVARYTTADGALWFRLPRDGRSYQNLQRDSRIACCAEQNPDYLEIAAVVVHGRAEEVSDAAQAESMSQRIDARGPELPSGRPGDSALFRVPIGEDVMSFDFSKIVDKSRSIYH